MKIRSRFFKVSSILAVFLSLVSCNILSSIGDLEPSPPLPTNPPVQLATSVASQPAAGICGEAQGTVVTMTINPDIPDPRCVVVRPDQKLRVVNRRDETLGISLGRLSVTLEPGTEHTFEQPFGHLLLPGVHSLGVTPCCGGEIWLTDVFLQTTGDDPRGCAVFEPGLNL
jgi:hypothetical protein